MKNNMDAITRIEENFSLLSNLVKMDFKYIPGVDESLDRYEASHDILQIYCYGPTEKDALASARQELFGRMLKNPALEKIVIQIISSNSSDQ